MKISQADSLVIQREYKKKGGWEVHSGLQESVVIANLDLKKIVSGLCDICFLIWSTSEG